MINLCVSTRSYYSNAKDVAQKIDIYLVLYNLCCKVIYAEESSDLDEIRNIYEWGAQ